MLTAAESAEDWAVALRDRIGRQRGWVALARKIAIILLTMWRTGSEFEPRPNWPAYKQPDYG
jgi:hypothetical protein